MAEAGHVVYEVLLDRDATAAEVDGVAQALRSSGLEAEVVPAIERRSSIQLPWIIMISVPISAFFTAFAAEAGKDAYRGLADFVRALVAARRGGRGSIEIARSLTIPSNVTDDALRALLEVPPDSLEQGLWIWESESGTWRNISPPRS